MDDNVIEFGGPIYACHNCANDPDAVRPPDVALGVLFPVLEKGMGSAPRVCAYCAEPVLRVTEQDLAVLNRWFADTWAAGVARGERVREATEGYATRAVVARMRNMVGELRAVEIEPDARAAAELTRLAFDVEEALIERAERTAERAVKRRKK